MVVIGLVAPILGCSSDEHAANGAKTFRSRAYPYSIELPRGWSGIHARRQLQPGTPPLIGPPVTDVFAARPDRMVRRMKLPVFVVGAQPVRSGTNLESWVTQLRAVVRDQKGCRAPARTRRIRVDGERGALLVYPSCPTGSGLDHLWVAFVHGDLGYHAVLFDSDGHLPAMRERLHRLLAGIDFAA